MTDITVTAPDLGVEQAEVIEIMVAVGDTVAADDTILLVESDKASVEVPAGKDGTISAVLVNMGDAIRQGSELVKLAESGASEAAPAAEAEKAPAVEQAAPEATPAESAPAPAAPVSTEASEQAFPLPDLGVAKAEVIEVMAKVGDTVTEDDTIVLLESEKASMEVPSPAAGEIVALHMKQGDSVSQGDAFIVIKTAGASATTSLPAATEQPAPEKAVPQPAEHAKPKAAPTPAAPSQPVTPANPNKAVYAGPAVRQLCRQLGVDITLVTGTAVNGRILKEDVHAFVKSRMEQPATAASANVPAPTGLPPLPNMTGAEWGELHEEPLTNLQKVSIPQLTYNTLIPQVTQFDLSDITDTEAYRQQVKAELKKDGVSLTIVAFVIKAVAYALKKYPKFNSHLSDDHKSLIMRDEIHIGMAVATDSGLIVPVLRHADKKGLAQIATELGELARKARDKKIGMKDLTGAGFSISSQGNMGGTYFTPLVNVPQVAILGVSEATMQPRWNAQTKSFDPRLMLPLSLSYDHRVINGADAAVFTRYLGNLLADVRKILL